MDEDDSIVMDGKRHTASRYREILGSPARKDLDLVKYMILLLLDSGRPIMDGKRHIACRYRGEILGSSARKALDLVKYTILLLLGSGRPRRFIAWLETAPS